MKRLILLLLLGACTKSDWTLDPKASIRRMAEARLYSCVAVHPCSDAPWCYDTVRDFCLDAGMEKGCGEGYQGPLKCDSYL